MNSIEDVLDIDLNDVVSKAVKERIKELESTIQAQRKTISDKAAEITALKARIDKEGSDSLIMGRLREKYAALKTTHDEKGNVDEYVGKLRFGMIADLMEMAYGKIPTGGGWHGYRSGNMINNLAVNFHNCKDELCSVMRVLCPDHSDLIPRIKAFKMPWDYPKNVVIQFLKDLPYNTNGHMFGIHEYWVNEGIGIKNMPWDLIMKSPYMIEDDVFGLLIDAISGKPYRKSESYLLFALPSHNASVTQDQINQMANVAANYTDTELKESEVTKFITKRLKDLPDEIVEKFFARAKGTANYSLLSWQWFPVEWQKKFLKQKPFSEVWNIVTGYNCQWKQEEKESFIKEYFTETAV